MILTVLSILLCLAFLAILSLSIEIRKLRKDNNKIFFYLVKFEKDQFDSISEITRIKQSMFKLRQDVNEFKEGINL